MLDQQQNQYPTSLQAAYNLVVLREPIQHAIPSWLSWLQSPQEATCMALQHQLRDADSMVNPALN